MRPLGELKIRNQFIYTSNPHATKHPPGLFAKLLVLVTLTQIMHMFPTPPLSNNSTQ